MGWLILLALLLVLAPFILKGKAKVQPDYPYCRENALFSAAERSFYGVLCKAVEDKAIVFAKVRVADVLQTENGLSASERQTSFNRISAKHFDFLLCKSDDLSIIAAVELDDSSHGAKRAVERDKFLEGVCQSAQLPLHRFKAKNNYNIADLRAEIFQANQSKGNLSSPEQTIEPSLPAQHN